jgi:hypothetical protein
MRERRAGWWRGEPIEVWLGWLGLVGLVVLCCVLALLEAGCDEGPGRPLVTVHRPEDAGRVLPVFGGGAVGGIRAVDDSVRGVTLYLWNGDIAAAPWGVR